MSKEALEELIWQQYLTIRSLNKDRSEAYRLADDIQEKIERFEFAMKCNQETLRSGECARDLDKPLVKDPNEQA